MSTTGSAGPSDGGCWYKTNAECEMLLRKIDGKMNAQNCGFSMKLRNGDGDDMQATAVIGNGSYHGLAPSFFEEMTHCDVKNIAGDNKTTIMVHRNSAKISRVSSTFTSVYVCAIATVVPRLTAAAVAMHLHRRISKR